MLLTFTLRNITASTYRVPTSVISRSTRHHMHVVTTPPRARPAVSSPSRGQTLMGFRPPTRRHRALRQLSVGVAIAAVTSLVAACGAGDPEPDSTSAATDSGKLRVALSWIKDVTFAGDYIADSKGYYRDAGFTSTELVPTGGASPDAQLIAKQVLVAFTSPETTAEAVLQGADSKIVGSLFQQSPMAVISPEKAPIATPKDVAGKRIAVSPGNELYLSNFLTANGVDPTTVTYVPSNYDPAILTTGEIDGYLGYSFDEPNTLQAAGFPTKTMLLADFGFVGLSQAYAVRGEDLRDNREALKAFFVAEIKGWQDNIADNNLGTELAMKYGADAGLDEGHQVSQNRDQTPLIAEPGPLLTISPDRAEAVAKNIAVSGTEISTEELFDLSLLEEVYAENPDLAA
ncbi:ABC transporter substrate-binding protein [Mycolicibacterium mengxianglii]|uniref:ABC transporter substrate-binding protein n=1 Tax=Mycolicibacterium mengxianglii TaxID=2736649 RepID=UPI0018D06A54|nr:ABC transporter substrate-binding protein [Mycolicibacterium mengxianglii]